MVPNCLGNDLAGNLEPSPRPVFGLPTKNTVALPVLQTSPAPQLPLPVDPNSVPSPRRLALSPCPGWSCEFSPTGGPGPILPK